MSLLAQGMRIYAVQSKAVLRSEVPRRPAGQNRPSPVNLRPDEHVIVIVNFASKAQFATSYPRWYAGTWKLPLAGLVLIVALPAAAAVSAALDNHAGPARRISVWRGIMH